MFLQPAGVDIGFSIGDSHGGGSDSGKVAGLMVIALPATHSTAVVVAGVKGSEDNGQNNEGSNLAIMRLVISVMRRVARSKWWRWLT